MYKFKEGDKVVIIEDGVLRKGQIKSILNDKAVVRFEDTKLLGKVLLSDLASLEEPVEEDKEPIEKEEITITPGEFMEIAIDVVANESKKANSSLPLIGAILMSRLHDALFINEVE